MATFPMLAKVSYAALYRLQASSWRLSLLAHSAALSRCFTACSSEPSLCCPSDALSKEYWASLNALYRRKIRAASPKRGAAASQVGLHAQGQHGRLKKLRGLLDHLSRVLLRHICLCLPHWSSCHPSLLVACVSSLCPAGGAQPRSQCQDEDGRWRGEDNYSSPVDGGGGDQSWPGKHDFARGFSVCWFRNLTSGCSATSS